MSEEAKETKDLWAVRRCMVISVAVYAAMSLTYLMAFGNDTALNNTIASGLLLLAGTTIGGYMGFAVLDDNNNRKK